MHQGCTLAPYLYVLAVDVLGQMLDDPSRGLKGLRLSNGKVARNAMFVDNTSLYLVEEVDNLNQAMEVS